MNIDMKTHIQMNINIDAKLWKSLKFLDLDFLDKILKRPNQRYVIGWVGGWFFGALRPLGKNE